MGSSEVLPAQAVEVDPAAVWTILVSEGNDAHSFKRNIAQAHEELASAEPERFFRPPVSARGTFSGWLGIFLDLPGRSSVDWNEIAAIIEEAYRLVAPRQLIAELNGR